MAGHFEEERFSPGEKRKHMVTVTPFIGKLKVYVRQFYVNGNGEIKPGKSGIVLEIEDFTSWLNSFHKSKGVLRGMSLKAL